MTKLNTMLQSPKGLPPSGTPDRLLLLQEAINAAMEQAPNDPGLFEAIVWTRATMIPGFMLTMARISDDEALVEA